jgi:hypothetical protein
MPRSGGVRRISPGAKLRSEAYGEYQTIHGPPLHSERSRRSTPHLLRDRLSRSTDYYLRCEPDAAFVVTIDNAVVGFLLGCRYALRHQLFSVAQSLLLAAKVLLRYRQYKPESKRYLWWILRNARREVPPAPRRVGHFHVNFLPQVKSIAAFREILETFLRFLADQNVTQISAQMVTYDDRRGLALLERYGFRVLNRSEITKFREFTDRKVYLSTILRDLDPAEDRIVRPIWKIEG